MDGVGKESIRQGKSLWKVMCAKATILSQNQGKRFKSLSESNPVSKLLRASSRLNQGPLSYF